MAEHRREQYTHGYEARRYGLVNPRTADVHGAFMLPHLRAGMSLLDCGCGPGTITVGLAKAVFPGEVVGIDFEEGQVERAGELAKDMGLANLRFQQANTYELPFEDESFDAVFAHTLLEHLSEPEKALAEMKRVMKPGGVVGVRDSDWGGVIYYPIYETMQRLIELRERVWEANGGNSRLGRHLGRLLKEAGFHRVEQTASYNSEYASDQTEGLGEFMARYFERQSFLDRVEELGLGEASTIKKEVDIWREWGNHPDAFIGYSNCEAIGWKP